MWGAVASAGLSSKHTGSAGVAVCYEEVCRGMGWDWDSKTGTEHCQTAQISFPCPQRALLRPLTPMLSVPLGVALSHLNISQERPEPALHRNTTNTNSSLSTKAPLWISLIYCSSSLGKTKHSSWPLADILTAQLSQLSNK